jgi:hypothetical protein
MKRKTTLKKERKVIREFHKQLRSGKDLDTNSMYQDAGKTCFLSCKQAGNIVRKHYNSIINEEMSNFINQLNVNNVHHEEKVILFAEKFSYCTRESRLIINYIIRK